MERLKRTHYSEEYKIEAIKRVLEGDESVPSVATQLGIKPCQLYNWMHSHRLPGEIKAMVSKHKELEAENKELRRQLAVALQEKEILKKAAAYFAKEAR
jgi:transposase